MWGSTLTPTAEARARIKGRRRRARGHLSHVLQGNPRVRCKAAAGLLAAPRPRLSGHRRGRRRLCVPRPQGRPGCLGRGHGHGHPRHAAAALGLYRPARRQTRPAHQAQASRVASRPRARADTTAGARLGCSRSTRPGTRPRPGSPSAQESPSRSRRSPAPSATLSSSRSSPIPPTPSTMSASTRSARATRFCSPTRAGSMSATSMPRPHA